jgi:hypothetical protein
VADDAFWVKMKFSVPTGVPYGTNTPEYLRANLATTTTPLTVPEPGSLLLLGVGALAVIARRRTIAPRPDAV